METSDEHTLKRCFKAATPRDARRPFRAGRECSRFDRSAGSFAVATLASILAFDLMRTLLLIKPEGSFTKAGEKRGLTQQAISGQVKRIETAIGRPVLVRGGSVLRLTADGEVLIAYAERARDISDEVRRHFAATTIRGRVRLGVLEGFASLALPLFLASLRKVQPDLEMIVETGVSERLLLRQGNGLLDVVIAAQRSGRAQGKVLWADHLRWFGDAEPYRDESLPVRLALPPEPSLLRSLVVEALVRAGRPHEIIFESESRLSLRAAALAGMAMAVFCTFDEDQPRESANDVLPKIESIEYIVRPESSSDSVVNDVIHLLKLSMEMILRHHAGASSLNA